MVSLLIEAGGDPNIANDVMSLVKQLLKCIDNSNIININIFCLLQDQETPLHCGVFSNTTDTVSLLLQADGDPTVGNHVIIYLNNFNLPCI